ncbi:MAG: type I restriction endonuclease subunit R, partial [Halopseudomonas aestusnigri]|nr:type I restriction endonuclease subunit R [Halopseudomonas aestusnigri]
MADSKEALFQQDIITAMVAQGWLTGPASGYDRRTALYTEDFLGYFKDAWPERWEKFAKANPNNPEAVLVQKLVRELEQDGTLDVLRHGFKLPGVKIEACSFKPDHGMNPDTLKRYQCNRLRVVPEVSYSPHYREGEYNPRLDLVLFVNGIPVATLELKSEFKQSVENAKRQYRYDRPVKDPLTRKPEPLLSFKRGALVHFAVSQDEVAMTTKLAGKETFFLPFNLGSLDGGAGNPPAPNDSQYATGYLWQRLFQPDAWLKVLGRFLHLQKSVKEDIDGKRVTKETLIFPRYHQWEVVNTLIETTRAEGPGKRYLIQHSAGSGKSNSIAWTAHQLASLYDAEGQRLFNSVIVITDRTVLDKQLQDTIYQFEHAQGVVKCITRDIGSQSKSEQLAEALAEQTRIIIVTIQTFPFVLDEIQSRTTLAGHNFAVIADEAHSSQTGATARKLKEVLAAEQIDGDENITAEDVLAATLTARSRQENISYFAFTATPKAKTLELFGRLPNPDQPPSKSNIPLAFHVYTMQQAIEEKFILDVLKSYTTYKMAWQLAQMNHLEDADVDSKQAKTRIAKWVRLHPYNIARKVEIIIEHFRTRVAHLLNGQAKAMVVTGSRKEAVRYKLAFDKYVREKNYKGIQAMVAFSGEVIDHDNSPNGFTENNMNPGLKGREMRQAFDTNEYQVMLVANKFQTGFDQPKLCAMYVDKK